MALPQTNQGFLGNIETVNTDVTSESVPSAFLGKEALQPTYEVASLQRNIPTVPTIDVTGSGDLYSGSNDLSYIVDLTTDPEIVKKRREEEKKLRARLDPDVDPLFATDPGVDITAAGISANVPDFKIEGTKPTIERGRLDTSTDITDRIVRFGEAVDLGSRAVTNPFVNFYKDRAIEFAKQEGLETAGELFKTGVFDPLKEKYVDPLKDKTKEYIKDIFKTSGEPSIFAPVKETAQKLGANLKSVGAKINPALTAAGAAFSAYNAYDAFKQGNTLGGLAGTATTVAMFVPPLQPIAAALTALNFASGITGFGRGKPKPGMGGSEIRYNRDTGQLDHSMTWSYNGFNPSQAKQHTDQARNFINGYMKEFNVKFDPEKASRLGQYHTRIDVSPYRNGSQSAGELIERWMSSGAFIGNPSYYDADAGERRFFTSQEEYEAAVNSFSNRVFS
jgi:hypothetical protein